MGLVGMVGAGRWVRVRALYCVYKSPHKDRNVRMHVSERGTI